MYLNEEGRKRLIALVEEASHPLGFRKMIEVQAQRLKGTLLGRGRYTPFYLWR
ncbi:CRISPR-associated protein Cas1 [Thermus thermophilus]|uniref:hypothetical protein n=1 Tax=Thermus thermophilus TaxID=274 RepID=UPI00090AF18E|nr:CRISPR-associated protein Cas1 [Thermus thermophilus]BDB10667.1 hypothetical protein TthTMY_04060 [Thermus thermophilus]